MLLKKIKHICPPLLIFAYTCLGSSSLLAQNAFDELFKGFDFDSFLKDMEKASGEGPSQKPYETPVQDSYTPASQRTEKTVTTTIPTTNPQTRDELFLTPVTQTVQERGQSKETLLTPESITAFKEVMHEFVTLLHSIQTKAVGSSFFSLPFQEQFTPFAGIIDKIAISYGTMISKKLYATILPYKQGADEKNTKEKGAQPKEGARLRQQILDAIKELKTLDSELTITINKEHQQPDTTDATLKELANKPRVNIELDAPALRTNRRGRSPDAVDTTSKQNAPSNPIKKAKEVS